MDAAASRMDETEQRISNIEDKPMKNMETGKWKEIKAREQFKN